MTPLLPVQPSQLPAINALILRAIEGWDLPARVKRLAGPSHCYDEVDLTTMDIRLLGDRTAPTGVLALETIVVEEAPGQPAWRIHGIYVAPEAQGQGYGAELLHDAQRRARAKGVAYLTVRAQKDAVGFFKAQGFTPLLQANPEVAYPHQFLFRL
jgi:GNAT superfamily N-acetyltransferase